MNPNAYVLPQKCPTDRAHARAQTLRWQQTEGAPNALRPGGLVFAPDAVADEARFGAPFRRLPGYAKPLPPRASLVGPPRRLHPEFDFPTSKKARLALLRYRKQFNEGIVRALSWRGSPGEGAFERFYRLMKQPDVVRSRWSTDVEFARQRLTGVNPMSLRRHRAREAPVPDAVVEAADRFLAASGTTARVRDLVPGKRLYRCDYPELAADRIQRYVKNREHPGTLAAPTSWFWVDDDGRLMPLAIQLHPPGGGDDPVFTPLSPKWAWMSARAHAQSADAHLHEGYYHLVETHLVNEAIAVAMYRQLHPDHPVRQLLGDHYEDNLAIDSAARGHLLAPGGPIDRGLAAGVAGVLDAARMRFTDWKWSERTLREDLRRRGVDRDLADYHYRDDALAVHEAIERYVAAVMSPWYRTDRDVAEDPELRAWLAEVADEARGNVPGFPAAVHEKDDLFKLLAELIFRAGPQHAAVNNGQFDSYGWIPNAPGYLRGPLPTGGEPSEEAFWQAMPEVGPSLAQMGMVWVLSAPTKRSILQAGGSHAFAADVCFEAGEAVAAFRRRLQAISSAIDARNAGMAVPYRYLDPVNISRSTDI